MRLPVESIVDAVKLGFDVRGDADAPVRVAVYLDESAPMRIVRRLRDALVPQTTTGLVRVYRLDDGPMAVKPDTDVALVVTAGGPALEDRVRQIVISGVPVAVICESIVEAPFIQGDTPMLGAIAATDDTHLLSSLAHWILDRTDKETAFAANFAFMRIAAAMGIVRSTVTANLATGALFFMPGADFPVMTMAQLGMMLRLATVFGKPMRPERAYEGAMVVASALAMRGAARALSDRCGRAGIALKVLMAGVGTYAMGRALIDYYERDIDYTPVHEFFRGVCAGARKLIAPRTGRSVNAE